MKEQEIRALVSLITDDDAEIIAHVEDKIMALGTFVIPYLVHEWDKAEPDSHAQARIENIIHKLEFELLKRRFRAWKNTDKQDLIEGLWLISSYQYPDLNLETLRENLQKVYYQVWLSIKTDVPELDQIRRLNQILFEQLQFEPNLRNFHAPSNSMIHLVLESRKGNPISLCMVYMLIAQKLNLPVYGVNLPNLFILTYQSKAIQFYINVFNKGIIYSKSDIDKYIDSLKLEKLDAFYQPCHSIDIVRRMLNNLAYSYQKEDLLAKSAEILELLEILSENKV